MFSAVGLVLEGLHGLKADVYLDVGSEPRRLMWTLAHAHGTLLGLIHVGFAITVPYLGATGSLVRLSWLLTAAGVLMPLGFFLGGIVIHGGDPGLPVLLVPAGAVALIIAGAMIVAALPRSAS